MSRSVLGIACIVAIAACTGGSGSITPSPTAGSSIVARPSPPLAPTPTPAPGSSGTAAPTDSGPTSSPGVTPTAGSTSSAGPTATNASAVCGPIEHPPDQGLVHLAPGETFDAYNTDPPTSGPHSDGETATGQFYDTEQPNEELVHTLEHGAIVFWVNGLTPGQVAAAQLAINEIFSTGYLSLVWVPYARLDVPFAMTAWGALQECTDIDPTAMRSFVETYYGSGSEGYIACSGPAAVFPSCVEKWPAGAPSPSPHALTWASSAS